MNKINVDDIWDKLEDISTKLGRIDELHNAVSQKYLQQTVDYYDKTSDGQLRTRDLCITHKTYTALLDIAHDYIQEIRTDIDTMLETATQ